MSNPVPSPESVLIEAARHDARLSVREAARRAGISDGWWRQIAKGFQTLSGGGTGSVRGPAETVAKMARVVAVTPEQLKDAGRPDAAEELERLSSQPATPPVPRKYIPLLEATEDEIGVYDRRVWDDIAAAIREHHMPASDIPGHLIFPGDRIEAMAWDDPRFRDEAEKARFIAKLRMITDASDEGRQTG